VEPSGPETRYGNQGTPLLGLLPKSTQSANLLLVKQILWDVDKNSTLHRERGVCFEDVLLALERGALLDRLEHPNQSKYPGQKIMVVEIEQYACLVPYVETEDYLFLKTVIPSRKATKQYLSQKGVDDETHE
jgi:uncharacterized DUF497 family protein